MPVEFTFEYWHRPRHRRSVFRCCSHGRARMPTHWINGTGAILSLRLIASPVWLTGTTPLWRLDSEGGVPAPALGQKWVSKNFGSPQDSFGAPSGKGAFFRLGG